MSPASHPGLCPQQRRQRTRESGLPGAQGSRLRARTLSSHPPGTQCSTVTSKPPASTREPQTARWWGAWRGTWWGRGSGETWGGRGYKVTAGDSQQGSSREGGPKTSPGRKQACLRVPPARTAEEGITLHNTHCPAWAWPELRCTRSLASKASVPGKKLPVEPRCPASPVSSPHCTALCSGGDLPPRRRGRGGPKPLTTRR